MKKYVVRLSGNGMTGPGYFQRIEQLPGNRGKVVCAPDLKDGSPLSFSIAQVLAGQFRKVGYQAAVEPSKSKQSEVPGDD